MKVYKNISDNNIFFLMENEKSLNVNNNSLMEIIPNTTDAATEKHLPVVNIKNKNVKVVVSSVEHPMTDQHYIEWVAIQTNVGVKINYLKPLEKPVTMFELSENEKVLSAYAYCNLHSLWKTEIN